VAGKAEVLDGTRIRLSLHERERDFDAEAERRVTEFAGAKTIAVARWFELWRILWWLFPKWDRLCFQMQHQQQTNWCWAAVSTSVAQYYDPATSWTQCAVANGELGRTDCCGGAASTSCNVYGTLNTALTRVGHLDRMVSGGATFQEVDDEIDAERPLGLRVAWSGGGAHFLAVIGYLEGVVEYVAVDDPIYGKSDLTFSALTTSYQGSGSWTHTYYTKA
jgi:hypothetical protein